MIAVWLGSEEWERKVTMKKWTYSSLYVRDGPEVIDTTGRLYACEGWSCDESMSVNAVVFERRLDNVLTATLRSSFCIAGFDDVASVVGLDD